MTQLTPLEHLFARVTANGWRLKLVPDGVKPIRIRDDAIMPDKLLADLKANRTAIIAKLEKDAENFAPLPCKGCGSTWYAEPDQELALTLCDRSVCPFKVKGK